jgi:GTP-binding protein Era
MPDNIRCGYVSIVGRPNVGKSTLINQIVGQKVNITSRKPQTTRVRTLGIKSHGNLQCIYIDTPGIQSRHKGAMNALMNREAVNSLSHTDVIVFVLEAGVWKAEDEKILELFKQTSTSVILAINKIDLFKDRDDLLPFIEDVSKQYTYKDVVPLSAKKQFNIERLEQTIEESLPESEKFYPEDQLSDKNERFFAAEFVREQLFRHLGEELPYKLTVTIDQFEIKNRILHISAVIWVESDGQKKIIIGKKGEVLKKAGTLARHEMEKMFDRRVFLQTWVKIKNNWTENPKSLIEFGMME